MKRNSLMAALLVAALAAAALAGTKYTSFTPLQRTFSCDIPAQWVPFEEETSMGSSVHLLGPSEADGAFRAAIHIHFIERRRPEAPPIETILKRERQADKTTGRSATPTTIWRMGSGRARRFEVTETRHLPAAALPSKPVILHHYYAMAPAGDGYFIIKLSSTRETYLDYRDTFEHLLNTFTVIGYQ